MPELIPRSSDNPEFARVIELRALAALDGFDFEIVPTPEEAAAVARLMGAQAVRKLRFGGRLAPLPNGGWLLDAALGASVVQTCVVTLEPVTSRIDQVVHRRFLPATTGGTAELVVDPDTDDDEIEPLGERIDLGLVAVEALALALPPYPRKEGAVLDASAAGGIDGTGPKPFAALAALRGKLDETS